MEIAAAVAGGATLAAYLDGKYQIAQDMLAMYRVRKSERFAISRATTDQVNPWSLFEEKVEKYEGANLIWSRDKCYSFREFYNRANQYGHFLLSQGVKPGQLVALYLQNCADFPVIWMALWGIGCAPALINYNLAGPALIHCLKMCDAQVLLVDPAEDCAERIHNQRDQIIDELNINPIVLDKAFDQTLNTFSIARPDDSLRRGMKSDFPSCLLYTSGTTGLPKASAYTMGRFNAGLFTRVLGDKPLEDRWYNCMPFYHGTGGMILMFATVHGISTAVAKKFSVTNFWRDIVDSDSTFFMYVGEIARYLLAAPPGPLDKAHKIKCMHGNGLRPDVWNTFCQRFNIPSVGEFFNSTEGVFALFNHDHGPYRAACVGHHGALMRWRMRNTYIPVHIDPDTGDIWRDPKTGFGKRLPYEVGGEMVVAVPTESVFQGYHKNPEATEKKFIRNLFKKGDLYYRSGDALRRTPDGHWHFLDRLGDTFRWKSENVSTAEVSVALGEYPGVQDANVYGVLVPSHEGRAGCAAVMIDPAVRSQFNWADFLRHARERLPKYAVPLFIRLVDGLSHTHNNKQSKVGLRDEGIDPDKTGTKVPEGVADQFLWVKPGSDTYVPFGRKEFATLGSRDVRL
ncbi:hypothetical protein FQN57_002396 [Myotisia sp. PD_48]|nr:hypothetical protein FQN57_002396 [Myotisia sp. PD_48]